MQSGSFTTLSETRDTAHSKEVEKLVSGVRMSLEYQKKKEEEPVISYHSCSFMFASPVAESVQSEI